MSIKLSICIPTYNFGSFIGDTLKSIIDQICEGVEIVVVDGASTDNTSDVVEKYQAIFPRITYCVLDKKGGIDNDLAKTVSLSKGEYCWFFSADDIMRPNAIEKVLNEIRGNLDIYLCGFTLSSFDMQPIVDHNILSTKSEIIFSLSDAQERIEYFRRSQTTTEFFSFCSSLVFRKVKWDSVKPDDSFIGTCWAHSARIFRMLPNGLRVKYVPGPLLFKRCDNDSFSDKGLINRMRISVDGYHRIADVFFGENSEEAFHIRRCVRAEWPLEQIIKMKMNCLANKNTSELMMLNELVNRHYADASILNKVSRIVYYHANLKVYMALRVTVNKTKAKIKPYYKSLKLRLSIQ